MATTPGNTPRRKTRYACLLVALGLAIVCLRAHSATTPAPAATPATNATLDDKNAVAYEKTIKPLLEKYCYACHGNGNSKGDVALDSYKSIADIKKGADTWATALKMVHTREMPASDAGLFPTEDERNTIVTWAESTLYNYDPAKPDPGRVTIHRLNRSEYNNTIRDLVGLDFHPADDFPADNSGYGFDNVSDVLSMPPVLMEKYLAAANKILDQAIPTEAVPTITKRFPANLMEMGFNADGDRGDGWMPLSALEEDEVAMSIPVSAGDYILRVQAFNGGRGGAPLKLTCMLDDSVVHVWDITAVEAEPGVYEARFGVPAGKHRFSVLNHRIRGGDNELHMENGRIGNKQSGNIWVKWVELEGPVNNAVTRVAATKLETHGSGSFDAKGDRILDHPGEVAMTINVPQEGGEYLLRAQAYAHQAGSEPARMEFRIDGQPVQTFDVLAPATMIPIAGQRPFSTKLLEAQPQVYEFRMKLTAGPKRFSAAFTNEFADPDNENPNLRVRSLAIEHLEVASLTDPSPLPDMPAPIKRLFAAKPATNDAQANFAAARAIVQQFATRAWRRPALESEVNDLMSLYNVALKDNQPFDACVKLPLKAILVSPYFLFRGEVQPEPDNPQSIHPIDEFALASRLSYFLWSSMPDDELFSLAAQGQLRKNLDAQVRRMLADPKSQAFVENFAGQWLEIRNLKFAAPDHDTYPNFDPALLSSMQTETTLFFANIMRQDRSVMDFINGKYTFVNEALAKFYGLPNVTGDEFRQVSLEGTPRRGLLTQASILTITSNPTRTSPVKRGKWVLEELLGAPPPAPPPNVPDLKNDGQSIASSLRQQMVEHRANPVCASCHARMDPIGFSLENFDGVGAYREKDGEFPIDPSGTLTTGENFQGPAELADILATTKKADFIHCLSEKMLTYALGRGVEYYDRPAIDEIVKQVEKNNDKFSSLILAIVNSTPFQMRRGEDGGAVATN